MSLCVQQQEGAQLFQRAALFADTLPLRPSLSACPRCGQRRRRPSSRASPFGLRSSTGSSRAVRCARRAVPAVPTEDAFTIVHACHRPASSSSLSALTPSLPPSPLLPSSPSSSPLNRELPGAQRPRRAAERAHREALLQVRMLCVSVCDCACGVCASGGGGIGDKLVAQWSRRAA